MLLMFPSGLAVKNETHTIKSLNRVDFDKQVQGMVKEGWDIKEMTSTFRKTLFGGVVSYKADLVREGNK